MITRKVNKWQLILGGLGSLVSWVPFIFWISPNISRAEMVSAVFFAFVAVLMNFAFFTCLLLREYSEKHRISVYQYNEASKTFEQIGEQVIDAKQGSDKVFEFTSNGAPGIRITIQP